MSSTESIETREARDSALIAPLWHTALLVFVVVAVAVTGTVLFGRGAPTPRASPDGASRIATVYLPMLIVQCGLLVYVARVGRSRSVLASLLGRRWISARALADVALAVGCWLLVEASEFALAHGLGAGPNGTVAQLLPTTGVERAVWVLVAVSVGFCEEVVYRGYLQVQLTAFTGSTFSALALQAVLFGMAHAEQGLPTAARLGIYGFGLGALTLWRGSLRPAILCHVGIDLATGLLGTR